MLRGYGSVETTPPPPKDDEEKQEKRMIPHTDKINGLQVVTSVHMTETITKSVYKNWKPGQRKGQDKRRRKLIKWCYTVPSGKIYRMGNIIICHPSLEEAMWREFSEYPF